jgi:hypothetical protein
MLFIIGIIVRSLWVKFPPPEGLELSRSQVPQLFALVDELTAKLQAPNFDNILLIREFTAGVVQVPRLGIFGWYENYLLLGLPLMQSLSLEQLKAVLAHELGHLSGNHSRFSGWIYRIRMTWMQIYHRLHQDNLHGADFLFKYFSDWYWPFFNAYSFPLARIDEYEADRCSSQLTGATNIAEALINAEIKAHFLENYFWSDIQKQVEYQPDPPSNTYSLMLDILHTPIAQEDAERWLEKALAEKTNYTDTHPCLSDRLKSLGYQITLSETLPPTPTNQITAAEQLLGNTLLSQFAAQFDQDWQTAASTSWRQNYAYLQETKGKLQALEQQAKTQTLSEQEAWERAYYTLKLQGDEAALPLLQDVLKIQPDNAVANYTIGQVFLRKADVSGIAYIEKAIATRMDWIIEGCKLVYGFLCQQGQPEEARKYSARAEQHYQLLRKAQQERSVVNNEDIFKPHTLQISEINQLKQQLVTYRQVKQAYLVEKVLSYFPEERFCVLGIIRKRGFVENEDVAHKLIQKLVKEIEFPTNSYIIILNETGYGKLKKKISQVDRSLIFQR